MSDPNHPRLDFDALIRDYIENLNVTLRSFTAAGEFEFLSTFVPSDDPTLSVLEVLDLAKDAKIPRITLVVGRQTLGELDFKKIEAEKGAGQRRQVGDQTELEFLLA